jgi:glucokinase
MSLAIDFGGSKTIVGVVREDGVIVSRHQFATNASLGANAYFQTCVEQLNHCVQQTSISQNDIAGIGITVPGLADPQNGILRHAPYLGWKNIPVRDILLGLWPGLMVAVDNDVNACALAEAELGKARGMDNFIWVTVSTGVGGAVVADGKVLQGEHHSAGELGHVIVDWESERECGCGGKGCLEVHGSGTAIEHSARLYLQKYGPDSDLGRYFLESGKEVTAENVAKAAKNGVSSATDLYHQAGVYIGKALSYAINVLDPAAVFLGGGVSQSYSLLMPGIRETISRAVIGETNKAIPVLQTGLGYEAGFIGAAMLVFNEGGKSTVKQSVSRYISDIQEISARIPLDDLTGMIELIGKAYEQDRTIFVIGNGGSASTASHFAADLNKNVIPNGRRPRVLALTDNVEAITAWGNDSDYADVFTEQLKNFFKEGDTIVAISGSGRSPNILNAVQWAKERSATIIGLTGPGGLPLKALSDVCVTAPTEMMEQIEDFHVIYMHAMVVGMRDRYGKNGSI